MDSRLKKRGYYPHQIRVLISVQHAMNFPRTYQGKISMITQKPGVKFLGGVPLMVTNEVNQKQKEFYVSYNHSARDYGGPTTALVVMHPEFRRFFILCGDHRKGYEALETLEQHLDYYKARPTEQHDFSDKVEDL